MILIGKHDFKYSPTIATPPLNMKKHLSPTIILFSSSSAAYTEDVKVRSLTQVFDRAQYPTLDTVMFVHHYANYPEN